MDDVTKNEHDLLAAVVALRDSIVEENGHFAVAVYRSLTNRRWRRGDVSVALSWQRVEEVINRLRAQAGVRTLELAQTGGEGKLEDEVASRLEERGWTSEPFDTGEHQPDHADEPRRPPPPEKGEEQAPTQKPPAWREAEREAEEDRRT